MSKTKSDSPEKLFNSIVEQFLAQSGISKSKMFGSEGLKVGGKVFAMLFKGKLVVKLPRERAEALIASGRGESFDPGHGRLMKEWVAVEPHTKGEWLKLIEEARNFVASGI